MSPNPLNQPTTQVTPLKKAGLGQRFFAWITAKTEQASNQMLDERKQNLFAAIWSKPALPAWFTNTLK